MYVCTLVSCNQDFFRCIEYINHENFSVEKSSAKKLMRKILSKIFRYFGQILYSKSQFFMHFTK